MAESYAPGASLPAAPALSSAIESFWRPRVSNGRFVVDARKFGPDTVGAAWWIIGDTLIEDQYSVELWWQQDGVLRKKCYLARATPSPERITAAMFHLSEMRFDWTAHAIAAQMAELAAVPGGDEVDRITADLRSSFPLLGLRARDVYCDFTSKVRRDLSPQTWGALSALFGLELLGSTPDEDREDIEFALRTMRWALEVTERSSSLWATTALHIGHAYGSLGDVASAESAFLIACQTFDVGEAPGACNAAASAMTLRLKHHGDDRDAVAEAVALIGKARDVVSVTSDPVMWAHLTMLLGDAQRKLSRFDGDAAAQAAEASYSAIVDAFGSVENFAAAHRNDAIHLVTRATQRLIDLRRHGIGDPDLPPDHLPVAIVLLLRPLKLAGRLLVANEFRDLGSSAAQWAEEPDPIAIETVLTRALERFAVRTLGGAPEGFGAMRMLAEAERWKELFASFASAAAFIIVIPSANEGLRWELSELQRGGLLTKCVFVQPPLSRSFDVPALWAGAVEALRAVDIDAPPFDERGLLFRVADGGSVAETIPFDLIWENRLAERVQAAFDVVETPVGDPRTAGRGGALVRKPFQAACGACGVDMTVPVILLAEVDGALPLELIEGRSPVHECTNCRARNQINVPFLAVDFRDTPHLLYVPMEGQSEDENRKWLRDILEYLPIVAPAEWTPQWLEDMRTLDREGLAAYLRTRRRP